MLAGNGLRWRRWAWATDSAVGLAGARPRERIAPYVEPQPRISRSPARGPKTSSGGMSLAMPATLACAQQLHPVVVVRVVADVAGDVGLLEAADAVLQAGRARDGPRPGERLGVAQVRLERAVAVGRRSRRAIVGQVGERRDPPRLRAGGQERVGQVDDRGHVLEREAPGLDGEVEALARRGRRDDRDRRVGVAPEHAPGAGRPARSSSACRSTGRRAGRR